MGDERIPKAVYEMTVEGRRRRGRPRTRWKDSVLESLVGYGLVETEKWKERFG